MWGGAAETLAVCAICIAAASIRAPWQTGRAVPAPTSAGDTHWRGQAKGSGPAHPRPM